MQETVEKKWGAHLIQRAPQWYILEISNYFHKIPTSTTRWNYNI